MKIVALYNIKGGVGKTAAAVNMAYLAARSGYRTLLWDLDPQGASTFYLRIQPKLKGGAKALVQGKRDVLELIKGTDFDHFDLLPADFSTRNMDLLLDDSKKPTKRLTKLLQPLAASYDYVFLDCPPGISLGSEAILRAADYVLCPLIPTPLSGRTLEQLLQFMIEAELEPQRLWPFFSLVDRRKKVHQEFMAGLWQSMPELLNSAIPYASDVERMGLERKPLVEFAPHSKSAQAYQALWQEVHARINAQ